MGGLLSPERVLMLGLMRLGCDTVWILVLKTWECAVRTVIFLLSVFAPLKRTVSCFSWSETLRRVYSVVSFLGFLELVRREMVPSIYTYKELQAQDFLGGCSLSGSL